MGARPVDSWFLLPCAGSDVPPDILQGMVMGSQSVIEGQGSGIEGLGDYAGAIADQIGTQLPEGPDIVSWLKDTMPSDDEIFMTTQIHIKEDLGATMNKSWNSPLIATRYGLALIIPRGDDQEYNFWPYVQIRKVKTASMAKTGSMSMSGHLNVKKKRSTKAGMFFSIIRDRYNEDKKQFKERKKQFITSIIDHYKTAMRENLYAEDEIVMRGAAGAFDFDSSSSEPDLFPGFSSEPAPVSFDDEPSPAIFPDEPFVAADDDDWMEEPPLDNTPAAVSTPEPTEQDWNWDDWED